MTCKVIIKIVRFCSQKSWMITKSDIDLDFCIMKMQSDCLMQKMTRYRSIYKNSYEKRLKEQLICRVNC